MKIEEKKDGQIWRSNKGESVKVVLDPWSGEVEFVSEGGARYKKLKNTGKWRKTHEADGTETVELPDGSSVIWRDSEGFDFLYGSQWGAPLCINGQNPKQPKVLTLKLYPVEP